MLYWILALVLIIYLIYSYVIKPLTCWSRKGIVQNSVLCELVNIFRLILQLKSQVDLMLESYEDFPNHRYSGSYQFLRPILFIRDAELIKQIAIKDFDHFTDHNLIIPEDNEPLFGRNLFALKGDNWRDMRATLSPSFTSSKMRAMFLLMNDCAKQFVEYFKNQPIQAIDMKNAFTKFGNDVIASTAFGITCNSLKDPNNEFYMMGKEATNFRGLWTSIKIFTIILFPKLSLLLGVTVFSDQVSKFFRRLVKTNIESREQNGIVRHDMIHLLMEARKGRLKNETEKEDVDTGFAVIEESELGKDETRQKPLLTDDDITAQALVFFFAGFESVSTLMCFLIYELGIAPDIQQSLREEVQETFEHGGGLLTYEALLKMKYMDMVVTEVLRKWPAQIIIDRVCVKSYTIQPANDKESPVHIDKGQIVGIPVYGIHRNPEYYPNPDRFDPERFNDENKTKISPYTYLPFGLGPRSCIGNRFALLETKTILFHILLNFEIIVAKQTKVPLKLAKDSFSLNAEGGFWFELKPLDV